MRRERLKPLPGWRRPSRTKLHCKLLFLRIDLKSLPLTIGTLSDHLSTAGGDCRALAAGL
jgi:hypothetical protein